MPDKKPLEIVQLFNHEDEELTDAGPGENIKLQIKGIDESSISKGMIICDEYDYCNICDEFEAQVVFLELLEDKCIITPG